MGLALNRARTVPRSSTMISPPVLLILSGVVVACALLLVPLSVPVGPMYWDVMIYYDAANRIYDGQVPIVDFFAPVGPLGYYLFAGWLKLFPNGNPVLLAHWLLLVVTAPLMALVVADIDRRSRPTAFAMAVPFLLFALLPFNTREFYPFPGSDAFGIYNRQCCQLIYVLVAALIFMRDQRRLAVIVCAAMLALFLIKITGFTAALMICAYGFISGRLQLRSAIGAAVAFFVVLGALELKDGFVTNYIEDILALLEKNSDTILPRFMQSASQTFGVLAPCLALAALSVYAGRQKLAEMLARIRAERSVASVSSLLDRDEFWLGTILIAGIAFETQNTGSQAMIFVWPVVFSILLRSGKLLASPKILIATLALSGAAMLPLAVNMVERAARTYVGAIKNVPLESRNLKTLGKLSMRANVRDRADHLLAFYPLHQELYSDLVEAGELPTPILYSDYDFQIVHLMAIDRGIDSIRALEAAKGIRFDTIMSLNFVNPLPWLMDRSAPRQIAIGADPGRAVPRPGAKIAAAVEATDLVLYPKCPLTTANAALYEIYKPMLSKHVRIELDDCFDAFVNPRFADKFQN